VTTSWNQLKQDLINKAAAKGVAVTGTFELTARCNFSCVMCYIRRPAADRKARLAELSVTQWLDLARQARDAGMLYALFTGGEVFLRDDFREIYEGVVDMGLVPTIFSNGSLITESDIAWLSSRPLEKISITLYGATAETYGKVCGTAEMWPKVVRSIDALLDRGLNVELSTTVTKENCTDYQALLEFSDSRKLPLKFSFYLSPAHVGFLQNNIEQHRLAPAELASYIHRAEQGYKRQVERDFGNSKQQEAEVSSEQHRGVVDEIDENVFKCSAGKTDVWLTWDGEMTACGLSKDLKTNPLMNGFQAAWEQLKIQLQAVPACDQCRGCELRDLCLTCPVRLKNETGSYQQPSVYLCEMAKLRKSFDKN